MEDLTQHQILELLSYDSDTGDLRWKERRRKHAKSDHAMRSWNTRYSGHIAFLQTCEKGYRRGSLLGRTFLAHRVIWCLYYGYWPDACVDHIDGDASNNRISNLREASAHENMRNMRSHVDSVSRFSGVTFHKKSGKWRACIHVDGRHSHLGLFPSETDAAKAYDCAAIKTYGEFARLNFNTYEVSK